MIAILKKLGLLLASSVLLYAAWPPSVLGPIVFIALVPLLFYIDSITQTGFKKYFYSFFGVLIALSCFAFLTAYNGWGEFNEQVYAPVLLYTMPLSVCLAFFGFFKQKTMGFLFFVFVFGAMELFQMNWELNSPLLMLGNALSYFPSLIQHYSIWGVTGGSMFIVAVNVVLYSAIKKGLEKKSIKKEIIMFLCLFPVLILSVISFQIPKEQGKKIKVGMALLHFEHFTLENSQNPFLTINKYNQLISKYNIDDVEVMLFPESAVVNSGWIENLNIKELTNPLDSLCPGKQVIFGTHVFSIYNGDTLNRLYNVNYDKNSKLYYLKHNCSLFRSYSGRYSVKSKDKFMPFHERIPYPSLLEFLADIYNKDKFPLYLSPYKKSNSVYKLENGFKVNAMMCLESVFSDAIVKNQDADFIAVLANESWNYQDKGKEQYFSYMTPKAIESGKSIVKVANGGYSGYINSKGQVIEKIGYKNAQLRKMDIDIDSEPSFYSIYFDSIRVLIILTTLGLFVYMIFGMRRVESHKKTPNKN